MFDFQAIGQAGKDIAESFKRIEEKLDCIIELLEKEHTSVSHAEEDTEASDPAEAIWNKPSG